MHFDSHVHSSASPDSEMRPEDVIAAASAKGLGVTFTEHVDFSESHEKKDPNATDAIRGIGDFVCDFEVYPKAYRKFRGAGVSLGLEIGLMHAFAGENKRVAESGDYDFILGSIHSVDGAELYQACAGNLRNEPYAQAILSGDADAVRGCIRRYLQYAREMVEISDFFDSFGHIDYIARYVPLATQNFFYENFSDEFDALLRTLVDREIALEINTKFFSPDSRTDAREGEFSKRVGECHSPTRSDTPKQGGKCPPVGAENVMLKICSRFRELGGRMCTIGSDAHVLKNVGYGAKIGAEIADAAGLAVVHYKERKPIRCG